MSTCEKHLLAPFMSLRDISSMQPESMDLFGFCSGFVTWTQTAKEWDIWPVSGSSWHIGYDGDYLGNICNEKEIEILVAVSAIRLQEAKVVEHVVFFSYLFLGFFL